MYSGETMVLTDLGDGLVEWSFDTQGAPMNSLGTAALKEWAEVLDVLESGAGIKGLLLTSAKSSFIAGANIKEFPTLFSGSAESIWDWARHVQTLCNRLESLPFATVAAIDGVALGGGFELVLSADRRILSHSAVLGLPEVTLGI
ncbi:Fatty acid oxidation complex subunit alpha [compost metagenome]